MHYPIQIAMIKLGLSIINLRAKGRKFNVANNLDLVVHCFVVRFFVHSSFAIILMGEKRAVCFP